MSLALREMRRRPGRFAAAGLILFLIAALLVFLGGLADGLNRGRAGALAAQDAELVVFSGTADTSVSQSLVAADTRETVASVPGVAEVGRFDLTQLGARRPDRDPRDLLDVAVFGVELGFDEVPADIEPGTAWAGSTLTELGVAEGDTLLLGPARTPVTVVGIVDDAAWLGQGSLWVGGPAFEELVAANQPDEVLAAGDQQALLVSTEPGADPAAVAAAVDAATGVTETLPRSEAAGAVPEVDGGVIGSIILVTAVIAAAVVALFFALLTSERMGLYGVLKAIGARDRTLMAGVVAQSLVLTVAGIAAAVPLAVLFDAVVPPDAVPFALSGGRVAVSAALLLGAAVIGAGLSLRRVLRVDPASVIGTAT